MHQKLSNPPVTYVLSQIKFSNVENIAQYTSKLQDVIRSRGFPHYMPVNLQTVQLRDNQPPTAVSFNQWHFMDKDKQTGIILDGHSITIHTSNYQQFESLIEKFTNVLEYFNQILHIALFTRIGLRYINLIERDLDKIDTGLLGFQIKEKGVVENKFLTRTETTQFSKEGIIRIQATHVGDKDIVSRVKNIFVPPDLADNANMLFFRERKIPEEDFLLLDIDHFSQQQGDFVVPDIMGRLQTSQDIIYRAFCHAVGENAIKSWI